MNGHQKQRELSGRMIEEALLDLMREKCYTWITVTEIVTKADVSRRTFYRIYREKDDVLRGVLERLCKVYRSRAPVLECYDINRIARDFFGFWYQYRELLMLMHKRRMDEMLYYEIIRASTEVVKGRMKGNAGTDEEAGYFAQYSAGGFILLLRRWIQIGMNGTPEEYAEKISRALSEYINPGNSIS